MKDFPENNENTPEIEEFSTIFSDPAEHSEIKIKNGNKKRAIMVLSAFLAVALIVTGTLAVIRLIPELTDGTTSMPFEDIVLLSESVENVKEISVANSNGNFKFLSEKTTSTDSDGNETVEVNWYIPEMDKDIISSDTIGYIATDATDLVATRKIDTKTAADCGLDTPKYQVDVVTEENGNYSILVGLDSPDQTGVYVKLSTSEEIYIVDQSEIEVFDFELLDLADNSNFTAAEFEGDVNAYYSDNVLAYFDSLTLSGKQFPENPVIVRETDERFSLYTEFIFKSPTKRYADNIADVLTLFSEGFTASGAYSLDVAPETLKKFGLDNPDITITIDVGGQIKYYKISKIDDTYCAVINEESKIIKKVALSNITCIDYTVENLYPSWVCMQNMDDISNLTVSSSDATYDFNIITHKEEGSSQSTYDVTCNGNTVDTDKFKTFFVQLITMPPLEYSTETITKFPDLKIEMVFSADQLVRTVTFTKVSETKYQYSIDGIPQGKIASAEYNKLVKYVKEASVK